MLSSENEKLNFGKRRKVIKMDQKTEMDFNT
jgi:hypothetical protein